MSDCVELPLPEGMKRMESTPMKFGDDWAGFFLRGDHAFHIAELAERAAGELMKVDPLSAISLKSYAEALRMCHE